jgi:hypothetical protein
MKISDELYLFTGITTMFTSRYPGEIGQASRLYETKK